jgi:hypothetical protein
MLLISLMLAHLLTSWISSDVASILVSANFFLSRTIYQKSKFEEIAQIRLDQHRLALYTHPLESHGIRKVLHYSSCTSAARGSLKLSVRCSLFCHSNHRKEQRDCYPSKSGEETGRRKRKGKKEKKKDGGSRG